MASAAVGCTDAKLVRFLLSNPIMQPVFPKWVFIDVGAEKFLWLWVEDYTVDLNVRKPAR